MKRDKGFKYVYMVVDKHSLIEHEGNICLKSNKHAVYLHTNYLKTELDSLLT